jgi:hypothetical protein
LRITSGSRGIHDPGPDRTGRWRSIREPPVTKDYPMTYFPLTAPSIGNTSWGAPVNANWTALNNAFSDSGSTLIIGASGSAYTALSFNTGGTQRAWLDASGRFSLTNSPVTGYGAIQSTTNDATTLSGLSLGAYFSLYGNPSSSSTADFTAALCLAEITNANVSAGVATGLSSEAYLNVSTASATLATAFGVTAGTFCYNSGVSGTTATITNAYGIYSQPGITAINAGATATILNYFGLYLAAPSLTGNGTTSVSARWGIYQADAASPNLFAGSLLVTGGLADNNMQVGTYTTGGSTTIYNGVLTVLNNNPSAIASYSFTMPSAPNAGQMIRIATSAAITILTVFANTGQTMGGNPPTTLAAGTSIAYIYHGTTWYRIL